MSQYGLKRGDIMCGVAANRLAENDALRKARGEPTKHFHDIKPNYSNPRIIAARDSVKSSTPKKESTPPLLKSSGDSGLSIRRSNSGSSRKPQRTTRSRAGARKRFQTK